MAEDTKKNNSNAKQSSGKDSTATPSTSRQTNKARVSKTAAKVTPKNVNKKTSAKKVAAKKTSVKKEATSSTPKTNVKKTPAANKSQPALQSTKKESVMTESKKAPSASNVTNVNESEALAPMAAPVVVKSGGGLGLVALLCSLGALGLSGYMYLQNSKNQLEGNVETVVGIAETKKDIERLDGSISDIKTNVQSLSAGVTKLQSGDSQFVTLSTFDAALDKAVASKIMPLTSQQVDVNAQLKSLSQLVVTGDKTYEMAKSRQWLEAAQYQIEHQANVDNGIKLLTLASKEIKDLDIPAFNNTRSKVLAYISELQAIETPDLVAVSNKLDSLSKNVSNWPLQNEPKAEIVKKAETSVEQPKKGFLGEVKSLAKDAFNESFKVQKVGAKPKVLLAPQERYFLDQNLRLKLQSSQLAMLQSKQAIFSQELGSAKDWVIEYFDEDDARVSGAVADLGALSAIQLKSELPDISDVINDFDRVAKSSQPEVKVSETAPRKSPTVPSAAQEQ